ncbi:MAG: type VI secretion system baseplate subunit TssE [Gammaproteobacteria bacterium]|nr:type VI secretion system baseplate subunit TssE [Gammaproteobacteria bacterium]
MKYLFERLVQPDSGLTGSTAFDIKRAVRENVQRLLANRAIGELDDEPNVLSCGLPSVAELGGADQPALENYAARIRRLIEHYEPRLQQPTVEIVDAGNSMAPFRVVITAKLDTADGPEEVRFPLIEDDDAPKTPRAA